MARGNISVRTFRGRKRGRDEMSKEVLDYIITSNVDAFKRLHAKSTERFDVETRFTFDLLLQSQFNSCCANVRPSRTHILSVYTTVAC